MSKRWYIEPQSEDLNLTLIRFKKYMIDQGLRESTIEGYASYLSRFLAFAREQNPPVSKAYEYRDFLLSGNLSRQTINNACIAIKKFYTMCGEEFNFKILSTNNTLPFFFDEEDVIKIFLAASHNIKHLSMLKVLFYCCLRASEICKLEDQDVNFRTMTIKVRDGKMGKDGVVYLTEDCAKTLKRYLEIRPELEIKGRRPLFYTDFSNLWDRRDVYRMFIHYKTLAGINKPGGCHVFSRHSPGCLMIKKGVNLRIVKEILRHSNLQTTLRYTFVEDETKRAAYDKAMNL